MSIHKKQMEKISGMAVVQRSSLLVWLSIHDEK